MGLSKLERRYCRLKRRPLVGLKLTFARNVDIFSLKFWQFAYPFSFSGSSLTSAYSTIYFLLFFFTLMVNLVNILPNCWGSFSSFPVTVPGRLKSFAWFKTSRELSLASSSKHPLFCEKPVDTQWTNFWSLVWKKWERTYLSWLPLW